MTTRCAERKVAKIRTHAKFALKINFNVYKNAIVPPHSSRIVTSESSISTCKAGRVGNCQLVNLRAVTLGVFASILIHGSLVSIAHHRITRRRATSLATKPHRVLTRGGSVLKPLNIARNPRESFRVVPLALGRLRARLCCPSRSGPPIAMCRSSRSSVFCSGTPTFGALLPSPSVPWTAAL
jgi:hypothetical protein